MKKQDKSRISEEIIFRGRVAKYTRQDYKAMKIFYQNLKLTQW
jgi:hypothetical protein